MKKRKIGFQDGRQGSHLGFPIGTISAIFDLQIFDLQGLLPSFKSTGLSVQKKKGTINFQDGHHSGHLGFPIGTVLAIFDLYVTLMLTTKFGVNWLLGLGEGKNRLSRWLGFPIGTILAIFNLQVTPMLPT